MPAVCISVGSCASSALELPEDCSVEQFRTLLREGLLGDGILYAERLNCSPQAGGPVLDSADCVPSELHLTGPSAVLSMVELALRRRHVAMQVGQRASLEAAQPQEDVPEATVATPLDRGAELGAQPVKAKKPPRVARVSLRGALSGEILAKVRIRPTDLMADLHKAIAGTLGGPHMAAQLVHQARRLRAHEAQADVCLQDGDVVDVVRTGCLFMTSSEDGTAKAWVGEKVSAKLTGHTSGVLCVTVSPDGRRVATGGMDRTLRLWDTGTAKCIRALKVEGLPHSVAFSPDGAQLLVGSGDNYAMVLDAMAAAPPSSMVAVPAAPQWKLLGHLNRVYAAAWSPSGQHIATASADCTAKVWESPWHPLKEDVQCLGTLEGHRGILRGVAWAPHGRWIATCSWDRTAKVWDVAGTGDVVFTLQGHSGDVFSVAFSPDGKRLATGSEDRSCRVWSAASGELLMTLEGHSATVRSVAFSLDGGGIITSSSDHTARIWDVHTGSSVLTLSGHTDKVTGAIFASECL